jgi:uncharacterized membrane protein YfcA
MSIEIFYILLFIVAVLYSSVGHGGASGYLALMAVYGMSSEITKPTALLLNVFVSLTSFIQFNRGGYFRKEIFLPLVLTSIPMSFAGGLLSLQEDVYKRVLGVLLLFPVIRFLFFPNAQPSELRPANFVLSLFIGVVIGFLSGLIGIGGGILLSPVLLLLKWTDQKQTAAISALFIFVNSVAGLGGQLTKGIEFTSEMFLYVAIAFAGGLTGAYLGALKLNQVILKNVLALVLLLAAAKLIFV